MQDPHRLQNPIRRPATGLLRNGFNDGSLRIFDPSQADNPGCEASNFSFDTFGLLTGSTVSIPVPRRGTKNPENWIFTLSQVPEFIRFSVGRNDANGWSLEGRELSQLNVTAERVEDLTGWTSYHDLYVYRSVKIPFKITCNHKRPSSCCRESCGTIGSFVWQKL